MSVYQLTATSSILRVSDGGIIPADPRNAAYQQYQAWLAAGNTPDPYVQAPVNLLAYAQAKQQAIAQGGFSVNANPSGAALNVSVDTSPTFLTYLSGTVQSAQLMLAGTIPTSNIDWFQDSGQIELTPQQAITVGALISALIQQSFTTLGQIVGAINAGTITTTAQIDAPPAPIPAWPVNT